MKYIQNVLIVAFWLVVWHIAALVVGNNILAVTPLETFKTVIDIVKSGGLVAVLAGSMGRIAAGLLFAVVFGFVFGICVARMNIIKKMLSPLILSIKSVPVASIVVLLLIWQGSENLSVWISLLIAFPIIYTNVYEGIKNTDKKLLEMADVFNIPFWNRIWYIYRPSIKGYILGGMKLAAGMSIKAGVAAEIIGLPQNSFGEKLYEAKIYLATDELFAWTLIIVGVAFLFEKITVSIITFLLNVHIPCVNSGNVKRQDTIVNDNKSQSCGKRNQEDEYVVKLQDISKKYGDNTLFSDLSLLVRPGEKIGIMAPSGFGKSTIFRIILGLEEADNGEVKTNGRISAVFQEPLLCEKTDIITNMKITGALQEDTAYFLQKLMPDTKINNNVETFSLGMKRRCSIIRALLRECDLLVMDEPFASIDEDNRIKAAEVIRERTKEKAIIIFTHSEEDIRLVGAKKIILKK